MRKQIKNMQLVLILSAIVSSVATVVIALFAFKSQSLAISIKNISNENQTRIEHLYNTIIITKIIVAGISHNESEVERAKNMFQQNYQGKTVLFIDFHLI
jgi:hypothetical protein